MRYHVIYQPGDVVYYTTNYSTVSAESHSADYLLNLPNSQVITWELNDLPLTQKFIVNLKQTLRLGLQKNCLQLAYDVYREPTEDLLISSRVAMNSIIDKFNNIENNWFNIPDSLKLDTQDINNVCQEKLNKLHDLFENNLPVLFQLHHENNLPKGLEFHQVYQDFQTINMLVHYNEKIFQLIGTDANECRDNLKKLHKQYFTALKLVWDGPYNDTYKLDMQPEDYKHFTVHKPKGWLELDFATVGKDLVSCAWTNDVELVKNNACSQQLYMYPWVAYGWTHFDDDVHHRNNINDRYSEWITQNKVGQYIDLEDPRYTPGRHMLGQCISHSFDNAEEFRNSVILSTPQIAGICLTDDSDQDIL